jgi:hypothetical protein
MPQEGFKRHPRAQGAACAAPAQIVMAPVMNDNSSRCQGLGLSLGLGLVSGRSVERQDK